MKNFQKAHSVLSKINLGWNLGNYLDATDRKYKIGDNSNKSVAEVVNLWHNPTFNLSCIDTFISLGVNCIRIPVTWCNFIINENNNISISKEVVKHLKNIIDYAINKNLYVILDMHHDDHNWLTVACSNKEFKVIKEHFSKIWQIIAFEFKDYGDNLIFEGMNEIVDRSNKEHHDWIGFKKIFYKRLNKLYSVFVKNVRQFSQNNKERTLMISTYGAQIHDIAIKNFKMTKDDNIILDMHFYSRHNDLEYYEKKFKYVFSKLIKKNIPVILGEIGAKKEAVQDFSILKTYLNFAKQHNIKCVLWDNGSSRSFINRETGEFTHNELKDYLK